MKPKALRSSSSGTGGGGCSTPTGTVVLAAAVAMLIVGAVWNVPNNYMSTEDLLGVAATSRGATAASPSFKGGLETLPPPPPPPLQRQAYYECLDQLPEWFHDFTPQTFMQAINVGSQGLTDKASPEKKKIGGHSYHHMYHRYMRPMAYRTCWPGRDKKIRILEIGLGCAPNGGMLRATPGGSARAWRHLFPWPQFDLELHVLEYAAECAQKWAAQYPGVATKVHVGDQASAADLDRLLDESGNLPFDVIIDDGSHVNQHQIFTAEYLMPHVARGGGVYIIEDIMSSCKSWKANMGNHMGAGTGGTAGCMETVDGKPTIYARIVEWQKMLIWNQTPFPDVNHVDLTYESAVLQTTVA